MSKKQPPYAPEYRRQAAELVPTGRAPGGTTRILDGGSEDCP